MDKKNEILTNITNLNIIDFNILIDLLENFYSIPADGLVDIENLTNLNNSEVKKEVVVTKEFEIQIKSIAPDKKISVLKLVKALTGLGLRETKEALDNLPFVIKKTNDSDEANKLKSDLEEAGATVLFN